MELEEFISKTLTSITRGIKIVNKNEDSRNLFQLEPVNWKEKSDGTIKFDIAVTAKKGGSKKGSGGILVLSLGLTGSKEATASSETVSRIKFNIAPASIVG